MFARKIRCFEDFCSLCSLPAQEKPGLLAKGAAGWGWGQVAGHWAGHWSGPRGGSGGERGRQRTLVSWVPFLATAEAVGAPPPCPLRCGLQAVCSAGREAGRLSWASGCPGPGPSEQGAQGEQGQQEHQGAWGGAA